MTQNANTSLKNCQQVSAEANKNWNLSQLYQQIESVKLQKEKKTLTPLEKFCLKGLFCGYTPEMISQGLFEDSDYYLIQITFWTLYRYFKTIIGRDSKEITSYQDIIDNLEKLGYKAENADTILLDVNNTALVPQSKIIPQNLQPKQNFKPQIVEESQTERLCRKTTQTVSNSIVVFPELEMTPPCNDGVISECRSTSKRLVYTNSKLFILLLSGLLVFWLAPLNFKWFSKLQIGSSSQSKQAATTLDSSISILAVETTKVNLVKSYQVDRIYTGTIVPRRTSSLGFERSGKLTNLTVDRGDLVKVGTPIAQLDTKNLKAQQQELLAEKKQLNALLEELQAGARSETIAAARSRVKNWHSQLKLAQTKGQRRQELYTFGAISREQLDEANTEIEIFQARLDEAQSKLDELLAGTRPEKIAAQQALLQQLDAKLASLNLELEQSILKAPFNGRIASRLVDEGTVVSAGESVFTLIEAQTLEVHVGVPVDTAAQISLGSNQQLQIGSKNYQAKVLSILPQLDSATRTLTVVLGLNESAATEVRAGQIARLKLNETITDSGYWLPTTALVKGVRGLWSCYVLGNPENVTSNSQKAFRVLQKEVEVLHTEGNRVFVRGTIQNSDRVIVNGNHRLVTGQLVRPKL